MGELDDMLEDLKRRRDELRVQMHLASKELKEEWDELEDKMEHFAAKAHLKQTREGVGNALGELGREIGAGYKRLRDALRD